MNIIFRVNENKENYPETVYQNEEQALASAIPLITLLKQVETHAASLMQEVHCWKGSLFFSSSSSSSYNCKTKSLSSMPRKLGLDSFKTDRNIA